jgi:DNA-directed RNA polymerase specialized sigma24 family protein
MSSGVTRRPPSQMGPTPVRIPMSEADLGAFYVQVFLPLVRRATWKHGLSKEDARDIVQDAFLLAIEKIDSARNPRAWLIQVVDHLSLNFRRKTVRRALLAARWNPATVEDDAGIEMPGTSDLSRGLYRE